MSEGSDHLELKNLAKKYLRINGFKLKEITEELSISHHAVICKVDVVGISPTRRVAIECGDVHPNKLLFLSYLFDHVIHLPYLPDRQEKPEFERISWINKCFLALTDVQDLKFDGKKLKLNLDNLMPRRKLLKTMIRELSISDSD